MVWVLCFLHRSPSSSAGRPFTSIGAVSALAEAGAWVPKTSQRLGFRASAFGLRVKGLGFRWQSGNPYCLHRSYSVRFSIVLKYSEP